MAYLSGIPVDALSQHVAIIGKTGSGKTYTAKGIVEWLLTEGRRVCIIDPTGAWWGLRSSADGKAPGFPVVVFGGDHADVPINEHLGAAVAELIAGQNLPCVIDLSDFLIGQRHRFMEAFAQALHKANRLPIHLILDEADEFAPQNPLPETKRMLHQIDRLVRRGRIRGFRIMFITQRPAVLHKNILTQANTLIAMRLTGPQDRKAVEEWIKGQADLEAGKEVIAGLPRLRQGEGWVWSPEYEVLGQVRFPMIKTFDSSKAPEDGDTVEDSVTLADVDLSAIQEQFAEAESEAKANDPKLLRKRIVKLERQLGNSAPDPQAIERARQEGYAAAKSDVVQALVMKINDARTEISGILEGLNGPLADQVAEQPATAPKRIVAPTPQAPRKAPAPALPRGNGAVPDSEIAPRHQRILDAIAWFETIGINQPTKVQVAFKAGHSPKSGAFNNNLGALRSAGLIDYPRPGQVHLTTAGATRAGYPDIPATSAELHEEIYALIKPSRAKILHTLVGCYPGALSKEDIARAVGQSPTSGAFNNSLGRLRSLGLIDYPNAGHAVAQDILFLDRP